jgi:hypothetical protein
MGQTERIPALGDVVTTMLSNWLIEQLDAEIRARVRRRVCKIAAF